MGLQAGTIPGEAIRFMGQFKGFPFAVYQKTVGREMGAWREGRKIEAMFGVARLIAGTALFGYMSMTAKDLMSGKTPRDPLKWKTFGASMLQGGGLGIYTDFLFGNIQNSTSLLSTIGGPIPTEAIKIISAINYAINGSGGRAGKLAYASIKDNIPFLNLFYLKTALDYAIGYQMMETLSPGALKRMEKRMEKSGQEFLLTKPSTLFKGF